VIKRAVLSTQAQTDLAALDRAIALRIEFRLRAGDWCVRNRRDAYR
jgi:hypothetical protein